MKKVLAVLAVIVAILAAAGYWAYNSPGVIVRVAIEYYGPKIAGVPVHVGDVDLSAADGRGVVRGFEIGTPAGFSAQHAVRVGEIRVVVDPATVRAAVVHIRELSVEAPDITYERGDHGTNLKAIQDNIKRYIAQNGGDSASRPAEARHGERKFIVDRVVLRGGHVTMTSPALRGQGVTFNLPDVQLSDVGARQGGLSPSEIGAIVAGELEAQIARRVLTSVDLLKKGGIGGALDALKGLIH
jgi:uncharacterized protein involved in outer membrane biogenesis